MRREAMNALSFALFCIGLAIFQTIIDLSISDFSMIGLENWGLRSISGIRGRYILCVAEGVFAGRETEVYPKSL